MTNLEDRWVEMPVHPETSSFQRIDDSHPLDFYLGKSAEGEWLFLLITKEQTSYSVETRAIHVFCRHRNDGRWALIFRLVKPELGKLFSLVCDDLVESSRSNPDLLHPASFVMTRFTRWQRLLERGDSRLLTNAALRGLVGELVFLETIALPQKGARQAINGWCGPSGADKDFCFSDQEFEIKTVFDGADRLLVTSAEQLDLTSKPLSLCVIIIDDVVPGTLPESFTIIDLVNRLRQVLAADPSTLDVFETRLIDAGLILCEEYSERAFVLRRIRIFKVTNTFPAIRRSELPLGIGKVSWELLIQSILSFEITTTG